MKFGEEFSLLIVFLVRTATKEAVTENSPIRSCQRDSVAQNYEQFFLSKIHENLEALPRMLNPKACG